MNLLSPTLTRCLLSALLLLLAVLPIHASQTCKDSEIFRWKANDKKDCTWVARKQNICSNKNYSARKKCPEACDSCGETYETKDTCPNNSNSRQFIKKNGKMNSCHKYPEGMECGFDHVWTGCSIAAMACTPTLTYQCNKDTLFWDAIAYDQELCERTAEDKPYGESCNPSQCPPFKPNDDESCAWYQGDSDCDYDYKVTGCEKGATSCSPTTMATCDPIEQTWRFAVIDYLCGTLEPCDPDTYFDCPEQEPLDGASCTSLDDEDIAQECFYQYKVKGCSSNTLQCQPGIKYTCDSNQWVQEPLFQILGSNGDGIEIGTTCVADDPRWGQDCDPNGCPLQAPAHGSDCSDYNGDEALCEYDYRTLGCSDDDALCLPTKSFSCVDDGKKKWQQNPTIQILCPLPEIDPPIHYDPEEPAPEKEDGPVRRQLRQPQTQTQPRNLSGTHVAVVGKPCIPDDQVDTRGSCPEENPTGTYCTPGDVPKEGCSYSYSVAGCTADALQCLPDSIFYCTETGKWIEEWMIRPKCVPPYGCPKGECDPDNFNPICKGNYPDGICPDYPPGVQENCSKTGTVDGGCPYRYIPVGCSDEEVKCLAIDRFFCEEDPTFGWQWQQISMALEQCPNNYSPPGECDEEGNYLVPADEIGV